MKKAFFFLSTISLFALASCSSDDNSTDSNTSTDVLVKRIIYTQEDEDGINDMIAYSYDGNKLSEANYLDGTKEKYYYSGDLITKIEYLHGGEVEYQDVFTYNSNGKLIEYKLEDFIEDWEEKHTFVHNADNTITETYDGVVSTLTIENGEVVKKVQAGYDTYKYTYDTKNSPFKNVTGFSEISYASQGDFELQGRSRNISVIRNETKSHDYMKNTFQYDSNDFPTSVVSKAIFEETGSNVQTLTVQYFY